MKLLYIALCNINDDGQAGVKRKIENQIMSFQKEYNTYLITQKNLFYCIFHNNDLIGKRVLLSFEDIYKETYSFIVDNEINYVYIRYLRTNMWMNIFLRRLKKLGVKVVIEFPTIPYDNEIAGTIDLEEDILFRNKIKKYVKLSSNYNGLSTVYGIPSISLHNGINIDDIPIKKEKNTEEIVLIAVSTMHYWHGYDRLIKGMANYYANKDVEHIVKLVLIGSGQETEKYNQLIKQNNLSEYVFLKGAIYNKSLDDEFDNADIAIGVLGQYRKNADEASPIKTKEYCARGLPIVIGHNDLAFCEKLPFIHHVANDDTDINIDDIVKFYIRYKDKCSSKEIRQYAEQNFTWDRILKPIKDYFNEM